MRNRHTVSPRYSQLSMFRQRAAGEPTHVPLATAIIVPATTEIHLWVCNDTIILMPARRIALRISECHRGGEQVSVFSIVFGTIESDPVGTSIAFGWDADRVQFHTAGQSAMNNDTVSQSRTFRRGNPILQQATKVITSGLRTRHSVPPSCRGGAYWVGFGYSHVIGCFPIMLCKGVGHVTSSCGCGVILPCGWRRDQWNIDVELVDNGRVDHAYFASV